MCVRERERERERERVREREKGGGGGGLVEEGKKEGRRVSILWREMTMESRETTDTKRTHYAITLTL